MGKGGLPCRWKMELFRDLKSMLFHERRIYIMGMARNLMMVFRWSSGDEMYPSLFFVAEFRMSWRRNEFFRTKPYID